MGNEEVEEQAYQAGFCVRGDSLFFFFFFFFYSEMYGWMIWTVTGKKDV
jgi:hypothetical protein